MGATEQRAPTRPRPGLTAFRPTRRRPELSDKALFCVYVVALALVAGLCVDLVRGG